MMEITVNLTDLDIEAIRRYSRAASSYDGSAESGKEFIEAHAAVDTFAAVVLARALEKLDGRGPA